MSTKTNKLPPAKGTIHINKNILITWEWKGNRWASNWKNGVCYTVKYNRTIILFEGTKECSRKFAMVVAKGEAIKRLTKLQGALNDALYLPDPPPTFI